MNKIAEFFRLILAYDQTLKTEYMVVDPSAPNQEIRPITLALIPGDEASQEIIVTTYWNEEGSKIFEKKVSDMEEAKGLYSVIESDLQKASELAKEGKKDESKNLIESLVAKYAASTDSLIQPYNPLLTETNASLKKNATEIPLLVKEKIEHEIINSIYRMNAPHSNWYRFSLDGEKIHRGEYHWNADFGPYQFSYNMETGEYAENPDYKPSVFAEQVSPEIKASKNPLIKKFGKIVMQNLFFDSVEEAEEYQEKMKALQPNQESGVPLWDEVNEQVEQPEAEEAEDLELAPPSVSYDQMEKDKAKDTKNLDKRIEKEVKEQIQSTLEVKRATLFSEKDDALVEAMRGVGRTWEEVREYIIKELKYDKDSVVIYLDEIRAKEEGVHEEPEPLSPPKPPEDLVSPETHDKLVEEVKEKSAPKDELKPEPVEEIARADNGEIKKVAKEKPLCKDCASGHHTESTCTKSECDCRECHYSKEDKKRETQSSQEKVALNPLQEPPAPLAQPPAPPMTSEPIPSETAPVVESTEPAQGDRVYVEGDVNSKEEGFEGTYVSSYDQKGDKVAVIALDNGQNKEVPMHRVVKASKKVAEFKPCPICGEVHKSDIIKHFHPDAIDLPLAEVDLKDFEGIPTRKEAAVQDPSGLHLFHCNNCGYEGTDFNFVNLTKLNDPKHTGLVCPKCNKEQGMEKEAEEHVLKIKSLHDAMADCSCGWHYAFTGPRTKEQIEEEFKKHIPAQKEAAVEVESKQNIDVIRMFINDGFPKDKMPVWGTSNVKIAKQPNGWALVNYETPIMYRSNVDGMVYFNTQKYSVTTTRLQNNIRKELGGKQPVEVDEKGIYDAIRKDVPTETPEGLSAFKELAQIKKEAEALLKEADCDRCEKANCGGLGYGCKCPCHMTPEERNASLKVKADPEVPAPVPTEFKQHKIAPPHTEKERAIPASPEMAKTIADVQRTQDNIEQIKRLLSEAESKLRKEKATIEQQMDRPGLEAKLKQEIERLATMVEATESKLVEMGDLMVRLVSGEKTLPYKISYKEVLERVMKKFPEVVKHVENIKNGAQSLAKTESFRELYLFPKRSFKRLSKLDKSAGVMDTLSSMYESAMNALRGLSEILSVKEEPVTAEKK